MFRCVNCCALARLFASWSRFLWVLLVAILWLEGCGDRTVGDGLERVAPAAPAAKPCGDDCPDGTTCAPIVDEDGSLSFDCVDVHQRYCTPCFADDDCVDRWMPDAKSACISSDDGSGSFCATDCSTHRDCPSGSFCDKLEDGRALCRPESGVCECSAWAIENNASTSCSVTNVFGACSGGRTCVAEGLTD